MSALRVVTVLPPPSALQAADALAAWPTSTLLLEALAATGRVDAVGVARGPEPAEVTRLQADATAKTAAAQDDTYRAIILLADGDTTTGTTLADAAKGAAEAKIPVFTIAYGTDDATIVVDGKTMDAGADAAAVAQVAEATGGTDYTAASSQELTDVYEQIGTTIGTTTEDQELTVPLALLAAGLLALAIVGTTAWTPRLT